MDVTPPLGGKEGDNTVCTMMPTSTQSDGGGLRQSVSAEGECTVRDEGVLGPHMSCVVLQWTRSTKSFVKRRRGRGRVFGTRLNFRRKSRQKQRQGRLRRGGHCTPRI